MGKFINFMSKMLPVADNPLGSMESQAQPQFSNMDLAKSERVQPSKSLIEDPLALSHGLDYKEKPSMLNFQLLSQMASKDAVISSILTTRINQVSNFTKPARYSKDGVGFEISMRNPKLQPTQQQQELILSLEMFLEQCGFSYDPHRDNFDTLVRKILRDSLTYDQMCMEIVPDVLGRPSEIYAVDASTVRSATLSKDDNDSYVTPTDLRSGDDIMWVQVLDGQVQASFTGYELAFGVRNPRTDIKIQPYGLSELEILVNQVTAHMNAEQYNSRYFSQGGTTKGIINIKGQNISPIQLDAFRRQWLAQVAGMTGAWKTPVVSVDGLEYINVSQSNREMEFENWLNYLINISCAVYNIDPAEVNFPNRGGSSGKGGGLGEGGIEDRVQNSKDKGLRPLLRYIEDFFNTHIIRRFTNDLTFHFVGLDPEELEDTTAKAEKEVRLFKTINEVRKERDLPEIENGDIILDGTFVNYIMQKEMSQQMPQEGAEDGQMTQEGTEGVQEPQEGAEEEEGVDWNNIDEKRSQQQAEDDYASDSIDQQYQV